MIKNDKSANRFLEQIKENLEQEQPGRLETPPSNVVINRAVRCTIIVGHAPEASRRSGRRSNSKG